MKQRAGSDPERFYWKHDMHFSFEGLEEYSVAVAAFMASAMIKPKTALVPAVDESQDR